jgi:hypothetical protein
MNLMRVQDYHKVIKSYLHIYRASDILAILIVDIPHSTKAFFEEMEASYTAGTL